MGPDRTGLASVYMEAFGTDPDVHMEPFRKGPEQIQNWTYKTASPVLDPFQTGSRTVLRIKTELLSGRFLDRIHLDPFGTGPV